MTARLALHRLQRSDNVKICFPLSLLANVRGNAGRRNFVALLLVIFSICANTGAGKAASVDSQEATEKTANTDKLNNVAFYIDGAMCPACLKRLQEKLRQLGGIADARVSLIQAKHRPPSLKAEMHPHYRKGLVEVDFDPNQISSSQISEAIRQNDFGVKPVKSPKREDSIQLDHFK